MAAKEKSAASRSYFFLVILILFFVVLFIIVIILFLIIFIAVGSSFLKGCHRNPVVVELFNIFRGNINILALCSGLLYTCGIHIRLRCRLSIDNRLCLGITATRCRCLGLLAVSGIFCRLPGIFCSSRILLSGYGSGENVVVIFLILVVFVAFSAKQLPAAAFFFLLLPAHSDLVVLIVLVVIHICGQSAGFQCHMNGNKQQQHANNDKHTDDGEALGHIIGVFLLELLYLRLQQLRVLLCGKVLVIHDLQAGENISLVSAVLGIVGVQPLVAVLVDTEYIIEVMVFSGQVFLGGQGQLPCLYLLAVDLQCGLLVAEIHLAGTEGIQHIQVFALHGLQFDAVGEALSLCVIHIPVRGGLVIIAGQIHEIKLDIIRLHHLDLVVPVVYLRAVEAVRDHIIGKALIDIKMCLVNVQIAGQAVVQPLNGCQTVRVLIAIGDRSGCLRLRAICSVGTICRHLLPVAIGIPGNIHVIRTDIADPLCAVVIVGYFQPRIAVTAGLLAQNGHLHARLRLLHHVI